MTDTLPDDTTDTQPVRAPVVYVVMFGLDRYDGMKTVDAVFTSKETLLQTINAQPGMKAWIDEQGEIHITGTYWYDVSEIELDTWE